MDPIFWHMNATQGGSNLHPGVNYHPGGGGGGGGAGGLICIRVQIAA